MKSNNIEFDALMMWIITMTLTNGIIYVILKKNIFDSYLTLIPLLLGYIAYLILLSFNTRLKKERVLDKK